MSLRSMLHVIWNGARAREAVEVALSTGLLARIAATPGATLAELAAAHAFVPDRLFKLLDVLETLEIVVRSPQYAEGTHAQYSLVGDALADVEAVFGASSQERDRESYPWATLHGRVGEVLLGAPGFAANEFAWPPATDEQTARFESSMVAGLAPIRAAFEQHASTLFPASTPLRLLDVGGGDGTLAAELVARCPNLRVDVLNLEAVRPLFDTVRRGSPHAERLGFVAADFLRDELPGGYDRVAFVRVLHDWPIQVALPLLERGLRALRPGGEIVICEEFRSPERLAAQLFWTYFLMGADSCWSRLREAGAYVQWLEARGYATTLLAGGMDLVVGRGPA